MVEVNEYKYIRSLNAKSFDQIFLMTPFNINRQDFEKVLSDV